MIKKRRFLWTYDVLATEQWLNKMANNGLQLINVVFEKHLFVFEDAETKDTKFFIEYGKDSNGDVPDDLLDAGYVKVCNNENFYIIKHDGRTDLKPGHGGIVERNAGMAVVYAVTMVLLGIVSFFMWKSFLANMEGAKKVVETASATAGAVVEQTESISGLHQAWNILGGTLLLFGPTILVLFFLYSVIKMKYSLRYTE